MTRRLLLGLVAALTVPAALTAQNVYVTPLDYAGYGSDTAFAVPIGGTRAVHLYGYTTGGVSSYSITLFFDTTQMRIVQAESLPGYSLPSPTVTPLANGATLAAAGAGYAFTTFLARITFEMKPTATRGSLMSLRVNQWTTQTGVVVAPWTMTTEILNSCLSRVLWGDPDSSLSVTGRDALIALTSAVQLPVNGFDLAVADVDADAAVTSRDALLMLSYAVSQSPYYYERTGIPVAGVCAPLAGVPSDMVFRRGPSGGLHRVAAGDSIAVPIATTTSFASAADFVRWAPDGTRVLATANTQAFFFEPIAITIGTGAEDTLARNSAFDGGGTYSPDGTQIAFYSDRGGTPHLWVMDANGANPGRPETSTTASSGYIGSNPAWSPDGARIAFVGYQTCCTAGLWSVLVADGSVRLEFPFNVSYPPQHPAWSPAGDSLAFQVSGRIYAIAAPDVVTDPRPAVSLYGTLDLSGWTSAGILFRRRQGVGTPLTFDYYVQQSDGRILRIYRAAGTEDVGGSFR